MTALTDLEQQALRFEAKRWRYPGARDDAILTTFEMTPMRYQQWIFTLIDRPEALAFDPQLVNRLRRLRATRAAARTRRAG